MVKSSQQKEKLHQLYALYEQPLYRIAYAILHQTEQAEDAVSDAFLKIIPHLDQIESPDSPKTKAFLIQVIRNTAINQYRKNVKDAERLTNLDDSTLQVPSPHNEVEQFLQQTEQQEQLAQLLQGLSETDRTILFLRCEQEQSFREIAERLSMKEATVRKRFERARKAIQKQAERGISYVKKCSIQP